MKLKPVIAKSDDWPEGSEENRKFWSATPLGEMTLAYPEGQPPLDLGGYYHIDLERDAETDRPWKLWAVEQCESQVNVKYGLSWEQDKAPLHGELSMSVENQDAWPEFVGHHGTAWKMTMRQVDVKHKGCLYTDGGF